MFGSKNTDEETRGVDSIERLLWGGRPWSAGEPRFSSVLGRFRDIEDWRKELSGLKTMWLGDDGRRISHIGMFGSVSYQTVPEYRTPPLETRLKAIEEALGLTYEYKDEQPAKWVTKKQPKAKKR